MNTVDIIIGTVIIAIMICAAYLTYKYEIKGGGCSGCNNKCCCQKKDCDDSEDKP